MMTDAGRSNASSSHLSNFSVVNCSSSWVLFASCHSPWHVTACGILALICLLGVPANIAVIVKLGQRLRGSSMSQRLFFNLAVSDLLCLLWLPVGGVLFLRGTRLTHQVCQLLFYLFFFCITSSLHILVLISIQRYCQVLHHKKWQRLGRMWQRFFLSSVWMLGALVALPVMFLLEEGKTEDGWVDGRSCKNPRIAPVLEGAYIAFMVFSHLVLLTFYLLLVRGVKRTQMRDRKPLIITRIFIRIITASLVVAFLPLTLRALHVAATVTGSDELLGLSKMLTFVECFYFFNHCLNPFLYFFASRHYKSGSKSQGKTFLMPLDDNS